MVMAKNWLVAVVALGVGTVATGMVGCGKKDKSKEAAQGAPAAAPTTAPAPTGAAGATGADKQAASGGGAQAGDRAGWKRVDLSQLEIPTGKDENFGVPIEAHPPFQVTVALPADGEVKVEAYASKYDRTATIGLTASGGGVEVGISDLPPPAIRETMAQVVERSTKSFGAAPLITKEQPGGGYVVMSFNQTMADQGSPDYYVQSFLPHVGLQCNTHQKTRELAEVAVAICESLRLK